MRLIFFLVVLILGMLISGCGTDSPLIKPADLGELADDCVGFIDITPADNKDEKSFLDWYGRNAANSADCRNRHHETIQVMRKNGSVK